MNDKPTIKEIKEQLQEGKLCSEIGKPYNLSNLQIADILTSANTMGK